MAEAQENGARYQATKQGGPFELVKVSKPVPEKDEVAIKTKAAGLNPIDYKMLLYGVSLMLVPRCVPILPTQNGCTTLSTLHFTDPSQQLAKDPWSGRRRHRRSRRVERERFQARR